MHMSMCKKAPARPKAVTSSSTSKAGPVPRRSAGLKEMFESMSTKELRQAAADASVDVRHCVEKAEMIQAITSSMPAQRPAGTAVRTQTAHHSAQNTYDALRAAEAAAAEAAGISEGRMACSVCGRRFALDR